MVACLTILFYVCSASTGSSASDWSLVTGFNAEVLVTCTVACVESGVYCIFGASGVNSSLCGVGSILTPVSWGVSEICSFFRGTTALVSCVINCARWWSTGPVCILATWRTCSFSGLAFLLEANPLFLWLCWSFTGSGTVSLDTRVVSTGGGIRILSA